MKKLPKIIGLFATILCFLIIYIPIIIILVISFTKNESVSSSMSSFSLRWYQSLFSNDYNALGISSRIQRNIVTMKSAIFNTFAITIISTIISTIFGTIVAIGINSLKKKSRIKLMVLNNIPVVNPDIVTGFCLLLVFLILENVLGFINFNRGFLTVLIAHIFFSTPYVILSVMPKLKGLDPNIYEAARDLGCSRLEAVIKVVIPSIKTGIIAGAMFAFTMSIDDFVISWFVAGKEFTNISIWIDARMRRNLIPKTIYAYNTLIFGVAFVGLIIMNVISYQKEKKQRKYLIMEGK